MQNPVFGSLVAAVLLSVVAHSHGQDAIMFNDGNSLYDALGSPSSSSKLTYALGYVSGVSDATNGRGGNPADWCFVLPAAATRGQLADVVKLFLEKNPSKRHLSAATLVRAALDEVFPCK